MFDDHLDPAGHDAGGCKDRKEPGAQKTQRRPPPERDQHRHRQHHDHQRVPGHLRRMIHPKCAVFEHERMGPHRQPEIAGDRLELGQPVRPRRDANVEAGRAAAIPAGARHQAGQQQPGGRQRHVQSPAPAPGFPKRARHKGPVIEQHDQRRGNHHFLGGHAEQAGGDARGRTRGCLRAAAPPPRMPRMKQYTVSR